MQKISQVLNNNNLNNLNNLNNKINNIKSNCQLDKIINPNCQLVDTLLIEFSDLIEPQYLKWFAKQFYRMDSDLVRRAASEARADGKDAKRLFAFLIRKYA